MALNVYQGPNSVADFFDPDKTPPLPLVEIPDRLNPFRKDGVRIYAKLLTHLPAQNVKSLPALNMLRGLPEARDKTIVEASSGSTVLSLGIIARVLWGNEDVNAYVTNKKSPESLGLLRFFGITPHLYGGLAQQEPTDPTGIMCRLRRLAKKREDIVYPGQYDNENNWKAHEKWTGPQVLRQLPEINLFCATVGTGGCLTGTAMYFKAQKPSVRTLGVFNVFGDPTPGPRHYENFNSCGFPWAETVDAFVDVPSVESFRMSMRLSREGIIAGPSSGQALKGLLDYLGRLKEIGDLESLRDSETGEVSCVFTCSDLPYQYLAMYFQKLGEDEFPAIQNEILLKCDQDKHDERWILESSAAERLLRPDLPPTPVADEKKTPARSTTSQTTLSTSPLPSTTSSTTTTATSHPPPPPSRSSRFNPLACLFNHLRRRRPAQAQAQAHFSTNPASLTRPRCCSHHHTTTTTNHPLILDLRDPASFLASHIPGSINTPLPNLREHLRKAEGDLFGDPQCVFAVWTAARDMLDGSRCQVPDTATTNKKKKKEAKTMVTEKEKDKDDDGVSVPGLLEEARRKGGQVVVLCYDGEASRLVTALLRKRGVEGLSVKGGVEGVRALLEGRE
ncbi:hypothetical protein VTJ49DRAFT_6413 [Mycothermus thermophilus]|uniref:Rhodanese domain-containing protein n=1 Tax=Humicola insolens TaxID=85995 RepID=A0ABR3VR01_HUMIN